MSVPEERRLDLPELIELVPRRFTDTRGYFTEVWRHDWLHELVGPVSFVQDNHCFTRAKGTIRGLHFQVEPAGQAKLVRAVHGSIFDVAVDIRPQSPNFGRWAGLTLSAEQGNMLFIPTGFAHGYMTLEEEAQVAYKVSAVYDPELERAIRWNDPAIGIDWPDAGAAPTLSPRDSQAPLLDSIQHEL